MSFPALAIAAAAACGITSYTGVHPAFIRSFDITMDPANSRKDRRPVFYVTADTRLFFYVDEDDL